MAVTFTVLSYLECHAQTQNVVLRDKERHTRTQNFLLRHIMSYSDT